MQFSYLEEIPNEWHRLLVIGRTIERDHQKYHIVGMSQGKEVKLYILEPFQEPEHPACKSKGRCNQRKRMKEYEQSDICYLHCSEITLGERRLKVQGGTGSPLKRSEQDYRTIALFIDMIRAGWKVPEWLREEEWDNLQLTTLVISNLKRLPKYLPGMPISIRHRPDSIRHLLEKTVTLTVGESRTLSFADHTGAQVQCHINRVFLIDAWEDTEKQFQNPKYIKKVTPEQLQQAKECCYKALEQSCPRQMRYIGIEYECSKNYQLQFYTKEYLSSYPKSSSGSASLLIMHLKPDQKTGTHGLPLKGCVMQTPVSPDTIKIPAELFLYYEKVEEWEEQV